MKYLLLGMGISNKSIAKYLEKHNLDYCVYDDVTAPNPVNLEEIDVIIKSPGIHPSHFLLQNTKKVITDLEFFYLHSQNKTLITVTGSNGKTTTVSLLKHLIGNIDLGGNIGVPLFDFIDSCNDIIIEASSFMLEYVNEFRSKYNVILNLFRTHLEHHNTYVNYIKSKLKLLKNTQPDDYIIYNYDDVLLRRLVVNYQGIKIPFSCQAKVGIYLYNHKIKYQGQVITDTRKLNVIGEHNYRNMMAAIGVILHYRGSLKGLSVFRGVHFRLELVGIIKGVKIYNDSKATNFNALYNALKTFKTNKVGLICGGQKRDDDFHLFEEINNLVKIYCYGENHLELSNYFRIKSREVYSFKTLEEVMKAIKLDGLEILLFSPGSVSYDQYPNYIKRGEAFNKFVKIYLQD